MKYTPMKYAPMKKYTIILSLALLIEPSAAQRSSPLGSDGPGGVCYFNGSSWQCFPSSSTPEPGSPSLLVGLAATLALLNQRRRTHAR